MVQKCPATRQAPYREAPNGWPYGRVQCLDCGGYVLPNRDGTLRKHVPQGAIGAYEAAQRAALKAGA